MIKKNPVHVFESVLLRDIDLEDRLTDFSLGPVSNTFLRSIEAIGVTHPVILVPANKRYRIACGHRRAGVSNRLGNMKIPAQILDTSIDEETMLAVNLAENQAHRKYTDVEKGLILEKLRHAGASPDDIIKKYMPMLELERSKKLLDNYSGVKQLSQKLRTLLHKGNIPLRTFSIFFRWNAKNLTAVEHLFAVLHPGANKWKDLLEWIDETAIRDEIAPAEIIGTEEIQSALFEDGLAPNVRYERVRLALHSRRYPILNDLRKRLARALDELKLDDRTRVHIQDSFESDEIRIELKFRTREQLVGQAEKLVRSCGSNALDELIRIFHEPK